MGGLGLGDEVDSYQVSRVHLDRSQMGMDTVVSAADTWNISSYLHILRAQNMFKNLKKHIRRDF